MPGTILFNKIALSDAIVFIGHVQMEKTSWQTRNRIRDNGKDQDMYLSVPIRKKGRFGQSINETEIDGSRWVKKHLKSLDYTYRKRPFFDEYYTQLEELLNQEWPNLAALNIALTSKIMTWLGLSAQIIDSRDLSITGHKTEMLISICKAVSATDYVSNPGAAAYIDEQLFDDAGLRHHWQKYSSPVYEQGLPFLADLSIIDMLFNIGPESAEVVRLSGRIAD
tara:strand:+ start:323 stop:991 length:669 start_codon:yes stop_codon:yes gene_type:complete